jgi:hypothetical protein
MKIFDDADMPKYIIGPWLQSYSSKSNDNGGYGYQLRMRKHHTKLSLIMIRHSV